MKTIHPFPARMAPEIVNQCLTELKRGTIILDPMAGSGTVLKNASKFGFDSLGFDSDPLAVLMARVWTTHVNKAVINEISKSIVNESKSMSLNDSYLPWIDNDKETTKFINYWFGERQKNDLRKLSYVLTKATVNAKTYKQTSIYNLLWLALSKIIIKKENGASLARDISHSRPHKVTETNDCSVFNSFDESIQKIIKNLDVESNDGKASIELGDARHLTKLNNNSIGAVVTSPPYLNAIDYMRGHKLSLVWMGYSISSLRKIRSNNVGAERGPDNKSTKGLFREIQEAMAPIDVLSARQAAIITRYSEDAYRIASEISRVLKRQGKAILVVGNSCIKGNFIKNSDGFKAAFEMIGMRLSNEFTRNLPPSRRYLPVSVSSKNPLANRMRTETVMTFIRP